MYKAILAALGFFAATQAVAAPTIAETLVQAQLPAIMDQAQTLGLDWKVGDRADYKIDLGIVKGTMIMSVKSIGADGIWMTQDADLGFAGKQKIETLIDPNTGEVKKVLVNGEEQQIPKQDIEVIEVTEGSVTVPAGTFDCIHARLLEKTKNEEINAWLNPQVIPMSGLLKQVAPSQFGTVTIELTAFKKN